MRSSIQRIAETGLGLLIVCLLGLLLIPWRKTPMPTPTSKNNDQSIPAPRSPPSPSTDGDPETILRLFVGTPAPRGPAPAASSPTPAKPATNAPWLRYVGYSSASDGTACLYLKDTKTGKMIKLVRGEALNGWSIIDDQGEMLMVKNGDDVYSVAKR
jgi:hypothetical protein